MPVQSPQVPLLTIREFFRQILTKVSQMATWLEYVWDG